MNSKHFIFLALISLFSIKVINSINCGNYNPNVTCYKGNVTKNYCFINVTFSNTSDCECVELEGKLKNRQMTQFKKLFVSSTWNISEQEVEDKVYVECNTAKFYGIVWIALIAICMILL